nr:3-deoxy-7-phosphoheptulonate synthase [uncultured Holophaga sp.]
MEPTPKDNPENLDLARKEIDEVDRELLRLLARRFDAVRQVATAKRNEEAKSILDSTRELAVQAHWVQDAEALGLSAPFARRILKEVLNHSRRIQEPLLSGPAEEPVHTLKVGYQGVPGAYSSLASAHLMATRTSAQVEYIGFATFPDVADALLGQEIDYAFLPVENSIGGSIMDVNRLIVEQSFHVVDEEVWEVEHVLAARSGVKVEDLREVRSHPAALTQCETFLRSLEGVERVAWFDTAGAAASLESEDLPHVGAICSEDAAHHYGLNVLERGIADRDRNETRFLLLSLEPETPDQRLACKTSLVFKTNHTEGALAKALAILADAGINLTRIESRPQPDIPWEYLFFVDVEGHKDAPNLATALRQLRGCCNHLRILGSYPFRTRKQEQHLEIPSDPAPAPIQPSCRIEAVAMPTPKAAPKRTTFKIGNVTLGEGTFVMMSGPCAVESREQILEAAAMVKAAGATILRGGAYKPRTSPYSFQGLGVEGLRYLQEAGRQYGMPVTTEVMAIEDILHVAAHADILQVGARNMHNFSLLKELGRLDKPILLKRGMSATVKELLLAAEYILAGGNQQVILCERGIRTFETATRSTLDVSAVPVLKKLTHLPVIVDPSHAAGERELVMPLALAAAAAGADGLIVEAHPHPEEALCDKEQALTGEDMHKLMADLRPIVAGQGRIWS